MLKIKYIILCLGLLSSPCLLRAYYEAEFSSSCYEPSQGTPTYLVVQLHYDTMGRVGFINFKGKDGIQLDQVYMTSCWNETHIPKGFNLYVFKATLTKNIVTITDKDFEGLPKDCSMRLTFTIKDSHAGEIPGLKEFAEKYWNALKSNDKESLISFYDPALFKGYTDEESTFIKNALIKNTAVNIPKESDSVDISFAPYQVSGAPINPVFGVWNEFPQYGVAIGLMKNDGHGGAVGLQTINAFVIQKDDKFNLVILMPTHERLKEIMKNSLQNKSQ